MDISGSQNGNLTINNKVQTQYTYLFERDEKFIEKLIDFLLKENPVNSAVK